jgi:hypothetical protein
MRIRNTDYNEKNSFLKVTYLFGTNYTKSSRISYNVFVIVEIHHRANIDLLCPFAVYYLRNAVRSFFTLSRISLADGKRAGQKIQRKIAAAVQKVKSPVLFIPLF